MPEKKIRVVSTFSGCGGSSLGYKLAGAKVVLAVEWEANAVETYKLNFPDTDVFHGDIAKLSVDEVLSRTKLSVGELDILDGSPPCQGFSTAGSRKIADPRNKLFEEYCRLLVGLKPRAFVMENVSGMVKGKMKIVFSQIIKSLEDCGYKVSAQLLNTKYFGVAQSRPRIIFIGLRTDEKKEISFPLGRNKITTFSEAVSGCQIGESKMLSRKTLLLYPHVVPGENFSSASKKLFKQNAFFTSFRAAFNKPLCTILKDPHKIMHPTEPRALTISELKRCASYPDTFQFVGTTSQQWERIGNSVPPLFMKAIAEHIIQNLLD